MMVDETQRLRLDLIDFSLASCPHLTPAVKLRLFLNLSRLSKKGHILTTFPKVASVKENLSAK